MNTKFPKHYIGDGVYAEVDDLGQILLSTQRSNGNIDRIYLEGETLINLMQYAERVFNVKISVTEHTETE